MNKKFKILTLIGIIVIGIIIGITIYYNATSKANKSLLIVSSYSNFAWAPSFSGTAIFDDGTIYSWEFNGSTYEDYKKYIGFSNIETKKGLEKFIIKKGTMKLKTVSQEDLKHIKDYINNLNIENISYKTDCHGADMGTSYTSIYKNDVEYKLREHGDCDGESKNNNVQDLLNLISKYM